MKKVILSVCIGLFCLSGNAQNEGGFRVGLDLGAVPTNGGGGVLLSLEPKYNIKDNMNVGLRIGVAAIVRDINDSGATTSAEVAANGSYVATYDYYFNSAGKSFVPYIGAGAGYYSIANVEVDDTNNNNDFTVDATGKMGGLVRGGFEWGKFRMGLEYNLVPESTIQDINGNNQGTVANSYVGIHLGFYVGGGKWGK